MVNGVTYRSVAVTLAVVLVLTVCSAGPVRAGGDLAKILAGAAAGYLMYKALDDDDAPRVARQQRRDARPRYNPPPRYSQRRWQESPRETYDRGYGDGWQDGVDYGYDRGWDRGQKVGFRQGYRTGYKDGEWDTVARGRNSRSSARWHPSLQSGRGGRLPGGVNRSR